MKIIKILIVCHANINRSPVVMGFLRHKLDQLGLNNVVVEGAAIGTHALNRPANEIAVRLLAEQGIDISSHRSRWIGDLDLVDYPLIVCMNTCQADQIQTFCRGTHPKIIVTNIKDPYWDEKTVREYLPILAAVADTVINDYLKPNLC